MKECCYPLEGAEADTAINMDRYRPLTASSMDGLKNRTSYISYTDTAFWNGASGFFFTFCTVSGILTPSGLRTMPFASSGST